MFLRKFPKIIILIWIQQFYFGKNQKYFWKLFYTLKKPLKYRSNDKNCFLILQWTIYSATSFLEKCRKVVREIWFEKNG